MNIRRREFLATAAGAQVLLATPQEGESGFARLFDGKTLDGWSVADGRESAFYVDDAAIVVHESDGFPAWLRSARTYENFDFRGEFFVKGWTNSGIYLHAPDHGRNMWCGMKINIFHQVDEKPAPESMGSIFPVTPHEGLGMEALGIAFVVGLLTGVVSGLATSLMAGICGCIEVLSRCSC